MIPELDIVGIRSMPRIVGVVNITEDSFSDGGRYLDAEAALAHAWKLSSEGADIIELGPASSHPDATKVTAEDERARLAPVLKALVAADIPVSVDSPLADTQRFAIAGGAAFVNDITGFSDPTMYKELAASGCLLVVMHSVQRTAQATRMATDVGEVWTGIHQFFAQRADALVDAGVEPTRLILDPGLGFFLGADPEPSLRVMAGLDHLRTRFSLPILISPSRKSFLRAVTGRAVEEIGPATLAAELYAATQGVDYIRTHDVRALHDALTVVAAIAHERPLRSAPRSPASGFDDQPAD